MFYYNLASWYYTNRIIHFYVIFNIFAVGSCIWLLLGTISDQLPNQDPKVSHQLKYFSPFQFLHIFFTQGSQQTVLDYQVQWLPGSQLYTVDWAQVGAGEQSSSVPKFPRRTQVWSWQRKQQWSSWRALDSRAWSLERTSKVSRYLNRNLSFIITFIIYFILLSSFIINAPISLGQRVEACESYYILAPATDGGFVALPISVQ